VDSTAGLARHRERIDHAVAQGRGCAFVCHAFGDQNQVNDTFGNLEPVCQDRRHVANVVGGGEFNGLLPNTPADGGKWQTSAAALAGD
jgi:hypothetical protein